MKNIPEACFVAEKRKKSSFDARKDNVYIV
jgi:hypothetical protein